MKRHNEKIFDVNYEFKLDKNIENKINGVHTSHKDIESV